MRRLLGLCGALFLLAAVGRGQVDKIVETIYKINDPPTVPATHQLFSSTHSDTQAGAPVFGDIIFNDGVQWARRGAGAEGSVLTIVAGLPAWAAAAGGGAPTGASYLTKVAEAGLSNEFALGSLGTGLLINTTTTGVPTIYGGASCTNQLIRALSASGAATCNSVSLINDITGILGSANGGTGNGFAKFSGPTTSEKTFTLPDASAAILTDAALVTAAQGGTANGFFAVSGPATSTKTFTFPNSSATVLTDAALVTAAQGGNGNGFFAVSGPATSTKTFTFPNAAATVLTTNAAVTVGQGGTGIASGTDGGVLGFTGTTTVASSALLTSNSPVLGGGTGATPKTVAGITSDGTSKLTLGVAGTSVGSIDLKNATSGTITVQPTTGALGTVTKTLTALTGTVLDTGTLVSVAQGGTGIASGTSGGVLYYSGTSTIASSAALTAHGVIMGGGAGASPAVSAAGTSGQPFVSGGASADGAYGPIAESQVTNLTTDLAAKAAKVGTATTNVPLANTVTETVAFATAVTGGVLGSTGRLHVRIGGDLVLYNNSASDTLRVRIKDGCSSLLISATGCTVMYDAISKLPALSAAKRAWHLDFYVQMYGTTNSQVVYGEWFFSDPNGVTVGLSGADLSLSTPRVGMFYSDANQAAPCTCAVDHSATTNAQVTFAWSAASANNSINVRYGFAEATP